MSKIFEDFGFVAHLPDWYPTGRLGSEVKEIDDLRAEIQRLTIARAAKIVAVSAAVCSLWSEEEIAAAQTKAGQDATTDAPPEAPATATPEAPPDSTIEKLRTTLRSGRDWIAPRDLYAAAGVAPVRGAIMLGKLRRDGLCEHKGHGRGTFVRANRRT